MIRLTTRLKAGSCWCKILPTQPLFDHLGAQQEFGASVFAIRPSQILLETVDSFVTHWHQGETRDGAGSSFWSAVTCHRFGLRRPVAAVLATLDCAFNESGIPT